MRTHTTSRNARRVLALAVSAALCGSLATIAPAAASTPATASAVPTTDTVLLPTVTSTGAAEQANPLRGQYRWIAAPAAPTTWPAPDLYDRDRTYWGRLEPTKGSYDFSTIDNGLADVGSKKAKFGFRVMAYCPGCWMEQSWRNLPPIAPSYVPKDGSGVPQWNAESFLTGWERLWKALGAKYGSDPRLGYVDVGGFGKYGEWMPAGDRLTEASARRVIAAVTEAFPTKHVLLSAVTVYPVAGIGNTDTDRAAPRVLQWALSTYPNLGMRSDCLGNPYMQKPEGDFSSVWKTRPFLTEWCTNGEPTLGLQQVRDHHVSAVSSGNMRLKVEDMTSTQLANYTTLLKSSGYRYAVTRARFSSLVPGKPFSLTMTVKNTGTAPTYDRWTMRLGLRNASGARVATLPLDADLQGVLPGQKDFTQTLTAPNLPVGVYEAVVEAVDPSGYSQPLALANASGRADGSYPLGTVQVVVDDVGRFAPTTPTRLLDTRSGAPANPSAKVAIKAGGTLRLRVGGVAGSPVPGGAGAALLNLTITGGKASGHLDVAGATNSLLNWGRGQTVANLSTLPLEPDGTVALKNVSSGTVHLVVDAQGWIGPAGSSMWQALEPTRLVDTRSGAPANARATALGPREALTVRVAGVAGSPVRSGAAAAALRLTVTEGRASGYLTVSNDGSTGSSVVNFRKGAIIGNGAVAKLAADGSVVVTNQSSGQVHVVVDVVGEVATSGAPWNPVTPVRLLDTRYGTVVNGRSTALRPRETLRVVVAGAAGTPVPSGASAIGVNATVTGAQYRGWLGAGPAGSPDVPVVNFNRGQTIAGFSIQRIAADGSFVIKNGSPGTVHVVLDVQGYGMP